MTLKEQLKAKLDAQAALVRAAIDAGRAMTDDEQKQYDTMETEIKALEKTIAAQDAIQKRKDEDATPVNIPLHAIPKPAKDEGLRVFKNLAEQLRAVKNFATDGTVDERLNRLNNEFRNAAPLGGNEGVGSEGGFAVQSDFAGFMMESAAQAGQILPRVDSYPVSQGSNRVEWTDIDETSVATTVFGGVQVYWEGEGQGATATQPKLAQRELKLLKLLGFAYATYELDQDSDFISQLYTRAFTLAIQRELEGCIVAGTGVGKPLGFTKAGCKVTVSKETSQAADTVIWKNISKIYNRALGNKSDYVWLMHPDCHEQLDFLQFPVGTGGVPVYLQAAQEGAVDLLKGKPVIDSDHCSAIGDLGDFNFVNLKDYFLIYKGGVQADTSMHVAFLTAQNCFRFIFRANGMPKRSSALTIKNSSNERSTFVTLEAR
jgi:HK97 family phage major capsid protein